MKISKIASILLIGSIVIFGVGCGSSSSDDTTSSTTDTSNTENLAKITGTFEKITDTSTARLLANRTLYATTTDNNVTLEVYDINENGELVKDDKAECEITDFVNNKYECSVEPNGKYVVKVVQKLDNGKVAVLNTPVTVTEGTTEANVTKTTTLVTQVVIQKVKESLESLKDYGVSEEVINNIVEQIIPVVEKTVAQKIESGEIKITETDFISTDENVTAPPQIANEVAVLNNDENIDSNVTLLNTDIIKQEAQTNTEVLDNAKKVAIDDYLKYAFGHDKNTYEGFIEQIASFLGDIDSLVNINETNIKDYNITDEKIEELKSQLTNLKTLVNTNFTEAIRQYSFFENPVFVDALNNIDPNNLEIKGTIALLLIDSITQNSDFTFSVFGKILNDKTELKNKYNQGTLVYVDYEDMLNIGTGSVSSVFTEGDAPSLKEVTIEYTDNDGNIKTEDITDKLQNPKIEKGVSEYEIDLNDYRIKNYSTVTLNVTFEDNNTSSAKFVYIATDTSNVDASQPQIEELNITSPLTVYSSEDTTNYFLTWSNVNIEGYNVTYKIDQALPSDVNGSELPYCDYVINNHCIIENYYDTMLFMTLYKGDNNITITPKLLDENGNVVGNLRSVSKIIEVKDTSSVTINNEVFDFKGKISGVSNFSDYKVVLVREEQTCNDSGCNDEEFIVNEANISSDGTYTLEINASKILDYTSNADYITYVPGVIRSDVTQIQNPWDFYWSDITIMINKDYITGQYIIEKYDRYGNYYNYSLYNAPSLIDGVDFTIYTSYSKDEIYEENTTIDENTTVSQYPATDYLGKVWGYDWAKITAFYDGDTRYEGNVVELNSDGGYITLIANKKDNLDSRAQVSAGLPYVNGFSASVNLLNDNVYSQFQVLAIAKGYIETSEPVGDLANTSGLSFIAGLTVKKNAIIYWWDIYDPATGKDYDGNVGYQTYDYDLTSLVTDGSDIKVEVTSDDSTVTYKVYNLANGDVIFEKTLNLSDIKITNFSGFNIASFRSRVRDDKANENGDEAIDKSENIVNDFEVTISTSTVSSVDDFLANLDFDPVAITSADLANKLIVTGDASLIYLNGDNTYKEYSDGEGIETGTWNVNSSVMLLDGKTYVAVQDKIGSLMTVKGYDDDGWFVDNPLILNATEDTKVTNASEFLALFDINTPIDTLTTDNISGQTWNIDNNTLSFNSDGTFTDTWSDDDGTTNTKTGTWNVSNNVLTLTFDTIDDGNVKTIYVVLVDGKKVLLGVDENGSIVFGGVAE